MEGKEIRATVSFCPDGPTLLERLQAILSGRAEEAPGPWNRSE